MKRYFAAACWLLTICIAPLQLGGQEIEEKSAAEAPAQPNRGRKPTTETASLLLIKGDWSKSSAAQEIVAELRLSGTEHATVVLTRVAGAPTVILCNPV